MTYLDRARAKYPNIDFTNPAAVAKAENSAMWQHAPGPHWDCIRQAAAQEGACKRYNHLPLVNHEKRRAAILAALPGSAAEISERVGLSKDVIYDTMRALRLQGFVTVKKAGGYNYWQEAA